MNVLSILNVILLLSQFVLTNYTVPIGCFCKLKCLNFAEARVPEILENPPPHTHINFKTFNMRAAITITGNKQAQTRNLKIVSNVPSD